MDQKKSEVIEGKRFLEKLLRQSKLREEGEEGGCLLFEQEVVLQLTLEEHFFPRSDLNILSMNYTSRKRD